LGLTILIVIARLLRTAEGQRHSFRPWIES
jgi:hypothetical protein